MFITLKKNEGDMKHTIALKVDEIVNPIEFEVNEETLKRFAKFCQEHYPEKNWKVITDSD